MWNLLFLFIDGDRRFQEKKKIAISPPEVAIKRLVPLFISSLDRDKTARYNPKDAAIKKET